MGAEFPRVSVFEGEDISQMLIVKKKLEEAGIPCSMRNGYLNSMLTTPTATALKLKVNINDEQIAFEIIDKYLAEKEGK